LIDDYLCELSTQPEYSRFSPEEVERRVDDLLSQISASSNPTAYQVGNFIRLNYETARELRQQAIAEEQSGNTLGSESVRDFLKSLLRSHARISDLRAAALNSVAGTSSPSVKR
jgi:hypothetical protein